ncbi:MAG: hypothetical protein ACREE5_04720 [Acetobacteraceae bacterium]
MLEKPVRRRGCSPPLRDFLNSAPTTSLRGKIEYGFDLGDTNVSGRNCRTLCLCRTGH